MKTKCSFLTIFLAPLLLTPAASADTITIKVLETFDYPGATETHPWAINDSNEIAGFFTQGQIGAGFTRTADGQFSAPIIEPDDTHHSTSVTGINNTGTICGTFLGAGQRCPQLPALRRHLYAIRRSQYAWAWH